MFRTMARYQIATDAVWAALLVLLLAASAATEEHSGFALTSLFGFAVALFLRRWSPALALATAWVFAIVQMFGSLTVLPGDFAVLVVLYCVGSYGNRILQRIGLASAFVGGVTAASYLVFVSRDATAEIAEAADGGWRSVLPQFAVILVASWGVLGLAWALGRLAQSRRTAIESRHARELAELEQSKAQHEIAVEQERNRIARDMHDIVAHSLAVVIAQADGARYARDVDPESTDEALRTISATAREALGDVRTLLGQLRHTQAGEPALGDADIDRLVEQMRGTGLDIEYATDSRATDIEQLGAAQQLALYRIVQESLTNSLRHGAPGARVHLDIESDREGVHVNVHNPLRPGWAEHAADASPGHGLVGMRERAGLSGGIFAAAPEGDAWRVSAWLPAMPHKQESTPQEESNQ
ncbi:sensor histidine kinase [Rhodococcus sp. NPDC058521]|uniref:sensor histidine kinase n=1 Tax=Rhodococcus sp. NPDC058521 TaxID=3346536 RepID=UPI003655AABE